MKKNRLTSTNKKKKNLSFKQELQKQVYPNARKDSSIQVTWVNSQGMQCKRIIEPNRCFCTHSFECHENSKVIGNAFCLAPGCKCKCYQYVPYYDIKCMCRHSYKDHDVITKMCKMCNKCLGFVTNWSCKCGFKYDLHETTFEFKKKKTINTDRNNNQFNQIDKAKANGINIKEQDEQEQKQNRKTFKIANLAQDARTIQLNKYQYNSLIQLNYNSKSPSKQDELKRKQIQRVNEKYVNNSFQKQIEENSKLQMSKIYRPELARMVSPLQLYIRPHNYNAVKLQKFLEKQYRKYEENAKTLIGE